MERRLNQREAADLKEVAYGCLCFNARKAARVITRFYDRHFTGTALEPGQFTILVSLRLSDRISVVQLADQLALERTTFTRNLRVLQRKGLVEVQRGDDARTRLLSLTEAGRRAIKEALPYWKQAQKAAASLLGKESFLRLNEALSLSTKFNELKGDQL